jgi:hypothetical protein
VFDRRAIVEPELVDRGQDRVHRFRVDAGHRADERAEPVASYRDTRLAARDATADRRPRRRNILALA